MNRKIDRELLSRLWHGADYNYEQWLDDPAVLDEDFRLMRSARVTAMSVGIFSWAMLEPAEGRYEFAWMDRLMDRLAETGVRAILATPSAAHPAWLSTRYPEVLRVDRDGRRMPHRHRQNFCRTAPIFREKCRAMNTRLAERYGEHPALLLWHVSNEYPSTPCHCDLCLEAFRAWLQVRYGDLETLNRAWWSTFWSHRWSDWAEIDPVDPSNHGLMLDWRRFNSAQMLDFYLAECEPLRRIAPDIPVTTNFMGPDVGLNYWDFAKHVDIVCWDSYPEWHVRSDVDTAIQTGFFHDLHRSYKGGKPFYLIESSPSQTNWQPVSRLKHPGLLSLASVQALAHGAMGVNYFQWRQSRGGEEKYHGAVVAHRGGGKTRVFEEVRAVGEILDGLPELAAAHTPARVALVYDFESGWVLDQAYLPRNASSVEYKTVCIDHYAACWRMGVAVDVIDSRRPLDAYDLVIAPMLHMVSDHTAARLADYVENGGVLVTTFLTAWVDENDLVHRDGYPAPLRAVFGFQMRECDSFGDDQGVEVHAVAGNPLDLEGGARAGRYAEILEPGTAETLAVYTENFYAGASALTRNKHGEGWNYHLGAYCGREFLAHFYRRLAVEIGLDLSLANMPEGVHVHSRRTEIQAYLFLLNFTDQDQQVALPEAWRTGGQENVQLGPYGHRILIQEWI